MRGDTEIRQVAGLHHGGCESPPPGPVYIRECERMCACVYWGVEGILGGSRGSFLGLERVSLTVHFMCGLGLPECWVSQSLKLGKSIPYDKPLSTYTHTHTHPVGSVSLKNPDKQPHVHP